LTNNLEEITKKAQTLERDLSSMQQQEKQYSENNIDLKDDLDEVNANFTWLNNDHVALVTKYKQFEHVHEELK
jgi:septal ring factor EnvC (AmiA/AmiB activator)